MLYRLALMSVFGDDCRQRSQTVSSLAQSLSSTMPGYSDGLLISPITCLCLQKKSKNPLSVTVFRRRDFDTVLIVERSKDCKFERSQSRLSRQTRSQSFRALSSSTEDKFREASAYPNPQSSARYCEYVYLIVTNPSHPSPLSVIAVRDTYYLRWQRDA
jgi:hypothetical protein